MLLSEALHDRIPEVDTPELVRAVLLILALLLPLPEAGEGCPPEGYALRDQIAFSFSVGQTRLYLGGQGVAFVGLICGAYPGIDSCVFL